MLEIALAEKYKTDTQTIRNCELLKRKPSYKLRKSIELLQNV